MCDDDWGENEARILCKSRGYKTGLPTKESKFGPVARNFYKISCEGYEARLEDCSFSTPSGLASCGIEVRNYKSGEDPSSCKLFDCRKVPV